MRDPITGAPASRVWQKRHVRARIYQAFRDTIDRDLSATEPAAWVDELVDEGVDRDLILAEFTRVWIHLRKLG